MSDDVAAYGPPCKWLAVFVAEGLAELERHLRLRAEFQAYLMERGETE